MIGMVLIGVLGGAYVAFSQGYVSLAWMPDIPYVTPKPSAFLNSFFDSTDTTNNIEYGYRFSASVADRKNGAEPLFNSVNSNLPDSPIGTVLEPPVILKAIPADMALNGEMAMGVESNQTAAQAKFWLTMKGSFSGAGKAHQLDLEIRKTDDGLYGIINKLPALPANELFDLSKVQSQWIEIASGATMSGLLSTVQAQAENQNEALKKLLQEQETLVAKILDAKVFSITRPLPFLGKNIEGAKTNQYTVRLVPQNVPAAYRAVIEEFKRTNRDTGTLEDQLQEMEKPDNMALLKRLARNTRVDVWLEAETGYLRRVLMTINIVPPDAATNLKDKQVNVELEMTMGKINQPLNIETPSTALDLEEAMMMISGASQDEIKFEKQIKRVEQVRSAIYTYAANIGSHPESFDQLNTGLKERFAEYCPTKTEQSNTNTNINTNSSIGNMKSVTCKQLTDGINVTDIYTNEPYGYKSDKYGYSLTYQIKYFDGMDVADQSHYADGLNTATSNVISVEKNYESYMPAGPSYDKLDTDQDNISDDVEINIYHSDPNKADTDGDGLTDNEETQGWPTIIDPAGKIDSRLYLTDITKADTDGDGYNDKQEICNGYDPRGSGLLVLPLSKKPPSCST